MEMEEFGGTIKIIFLGDSGVGKSAVLWRYMNKNSPFTGQFFTTLGVDYFPTVMYVDQTKYKVCLWDTAGQERFRSILPTYFKGSSGAIIVFDVTERSTFDNVGYWHEYLMEHVGAPIPVLIFANKMDMVMGPGDHSKRKVTSQEGKDLAKSLGAEYYEGSAQSGLNVPASVTRIVRLASKKAEPIEQSDDSVGPTPSEPSDDPKRKHSHQCGCSGSD